MLTGDWPPGRDGRKQAMTDPSNPEPTSPGPETPGEPCRQALLQEQSDRWQRGERVLVEAYLVRHPDLRADTEAALDMITHEVLLRRQAGETPELEEYLGRFPQWADLLRIQFEVERAIEGESYL